MTFIRFAHHAPGDVLFDVVERFEDISIADVPAEGFLHHVQRRVDIATRYPRMSVGGMVNRTWAIWGAQLHFEGPAAILVQLHVQTVLTLFVGDMSQATWPGGLLLPSDVQQCTLLHPTASDGRWYRQIVDIKEIVKPDSEWGGAHPIADGQLFTPVYVPPNFFWQFQLNFYPLQSNNVVDQLSALKDRALTIVVHGQLKPED